MAKLYDLKLPVHTLTVESVRDYTVCELFYRYRYMDNLHEPIIAYTQMRKRFNETLKQVMSYYFFKKQGDHTPSLRALINRWERLWFPKEMTAYDIAVDKHRKAEGMSIVTLNSDAVMTLELFHQHFAKDKGMPIIIDETFTLPIRTDVPLIRLECKIDLALKYPGNNYKVIKWTTRKHDKRPENAFLDFAAMKFAFEHANEGANASYGIFKLTDDKVGFLDREQPKATDIDALRYWAIQAVDTPDYLPRRGHTSYCKTCPFDEACANFNEWPIV